MDIMVDSVEVQEYHEFARAFTRGNFDGDQLARFLNERTDQQEAKWVVQGGKNDLDKNEDTEKKHGSERIIIENVQLIDGSWLFTEKIVIDQDSVLWLARSGRRTLADNDENAVAWPELKSCYDWLKEFYELDASFFDQPNRYRDIFLTKTEGVRLECHMHELLHPGLWAVLQSFTEASYDERGLGVVLHPFGIQTKVNFSPKPETMTSLSQGQLKASIGRDDLEIAVRRYEDYDERVISFGSQMPYHSHVKALRALIEVTKRLGSDNN